jgi:hypothetical protein
VLLDRSDALREVIDFFREAAMAPKLSLDRVEPLVDLADFGPHAISRGAVR